MSSFHAMSRDPWSLTFHILETLCINPSIPFEGYKLRHIQALRSDSTHWEQRYSREISLHIESASLCLWKFELLVFKPQTLPILWWITSLNPTYKISFVKDWSGGGPYGGTYFLVSDMCHYIICSPLYLCWLH